VSRSPWLNERIEALDVFHLKTRTTYLLPQFVDFVTAEVAKCTVDTVSSHGCCGTRMTARPPGSSSAL
jgi:hypothetical protein